MDNLFYSQFFQFVPIVQTCQMPYYFLWPSNNSTFVLNDLNLKNEAALEKKEIIIHRQRFENTPKINRTSKPIKQKKALFKKTIEEKSFSESQKKKISCQLEQEVETNEKGKRKVPQNALRNIQPNIVHQIFCFIQKRKRSGQIVQDFIDNQIKLGKQSLNIDRFYLYQRLIKEKTNNYVNIKSLKLLNKFQQPQCQVYSQVQQLHFLKMNRILLKYFLEHQFINIVLTSSRMKPQSRLLHFQVKRRILQQLIETLNQR